MSRVVANGIEIEYDTFGRAEGVAGDRPLLLVMGLGAQMIHWDDAFCEQLAQRGHYVIRFDNRDVGLSSKFEHHAPPPMDQVTAAVAAGRTPALPYTLDDMAGDAVALLDKLGVDRAHVCGASMGGMIAQVMALNHPDRLWSLTSIMSTTGNPDLPPARPEAMAALTSPMPAALEPYLDRSVDVARVIGSPGFPFDTERVRERSARAYERSFHPEGVARQMAAIAGHGNRKPRLRDLRISTLVIHGSEDPLVPLEGGRDTAEAIPGAELLVIEGMGHDLPPGSWGQIVDAIDGHTRRAMDAERA